MKRLFSLYFLLCLFSSLVLQAQTTAIPDSSFEQALVDLGIDSDSTVNGVVLTSDINSVTDLNIFNKGISNLTGIEGFDSLKTLNCSNNRITNLDFSSNLNLTELDCSSNLLVNLNVSSNTALVKLICQSNFLAVLDVTANTLLKNLDFTDNRLDSINISQNDSLVSLKVSNNRLKSLSVFTNTLLEELFCSNNQLDTLNLVNNALLRTLLTASNQLAGLDINANDSLIILDVSNNQLSHLDVSNNLFLTQITCSKNQLDSINVSANDSLLLLAVSNNKLTSIDLSNNKKLESIIAASNQLSSFNVDSNLLLKSIDVSLNFISTIDLSGNDSLTSINVSKNQLRSLNIQNGFDSTISSFDATKNPKLICILVDDTSQIGNDWLKDSIGHYNQVCYSLTYVPDDQFEQALIDLGLDNNLDNYIRSSSIDTVQYLNLSGKSIESLTGLEDFIALNSLDCSNNLLSNLDVSPLTNLATLYCQSNYLFDLTLKNVAPVILIILDARLNPLLDCIKVDDIAAANLASGWFKDSIATYNLNCIANKTYIPDDNFEQALIDLGYDKGSLDNYVVTDSINNIRILDISKKNIFSLDGIEAFIALDSLNCSSNNLATLDVSNLISLKKLTCFSNYLSELDIQNNDSLLQVNCGDNRLSNLIVSNNTGLQQLVCDANDLTTLDVSNNLNLLTLNCSSNNISNSGLDLSTNSNLVWLDCANNNLAALNITANNSLLDLNCSENYLTDLDLSLNTRLLRLNCSLNFLVDLDVSNNDSLLDVICNSNQLQNLNFSANTFLRSISCDDNELTAINILNNDSLRHVSVASNEFLSIDVSNNLLLNYLNCNNNQLPDLNISNNDSLTYLSLSENKVTNINTDSLSLLNYLNCNRNKIIALNLANNKNLVELACSDNKIAVLDLDSNKTIQRLDISKNMITAIQINHLDSLKDFNFSDNELTNQLLSNNTVLRSLNCSNNKLEWLNVKNGNNTELGSFIASNNPDLICIEIDDTSSIGANWIKDTTAYYQINCHYGETYIPDDEFEQALIDLAYDNPILDDYVLTHKIDTLVFLNLSNKNIIDLTGLQDFDSLQVLDVSMNVIDSINVSKNKFLKALNASHNLLDSINLENNKFIERLDLSHNNFTSINTDSLSALSHFSVSNNQLSELNLILQTALDSLSCDSNQLVRLKINNGNNINLNTFTSIGNPDLFCITVDDPVAANAATGWSKDTIADYSANCHYNEIYVPDDAFEQALINAGYDYPGVTTLDDYVPDAKIIIAINLNVSNKGILDFTGLEAFLELRTLNIKNNPASTFDISSFLHLQNFNCSGNQLTNLDISYNDSLLVLDCSNNLLDSIDLSGNSLLTNLDIKSNPLDSINLQNNNNLKILDASITSITHLDLAQNILLEKLTAINNQQLQVINIQSGNNQQINELNVTLNPVLACILVDNVVDANSNPNWLKDNTAWYKLICNDDDNDGVSNSDDLCPGTPFGDPVDLFGCTIFILPTDNFTIIATAETCRSSDNGKINVNAVNTYTYKATIAIDGIPTEFIFSNNLEIRNLKAGTYELCITIAEEPAFISCFVIVITEPIDLSVLRMVNLFSENVSLVLSGGKSYTIDINGLIFQTNDSEITLQLDKGNNKIKIITDAECQGIYESNIFIGNNLAFYPNPFEKYFTVFIGQDAPTTVAINIYSLVGQLLLSTSQSIQHGSVDIDGSGLDAGIYLVSLQSEYDQHILKIIKK